MRFENFKMSRRKSIFGNSTVAIQQKEQEESLSTELDLNLRTLALLHQIADSSKPLLVKDAFIKPNKIAFHHVVHFLVMIINVADFRKRFRWPIISSRDESDFRTATLSYFNECHKVFKWSIGPFKMHTVLFPGGVEIMKILIELTKVAMRTILKENDSMHLINSNGISLREATAKLEMTEQAFVEMERMCSKVRGLIVEMKERTCRLREVLYRLLTNTSISVDKIDQDFLTAWEMYQHKTIDEKIVPSIYEIENFFSKCSKFEQKLDAVKPHHIQFDKEKMNALGLLNISEHFNPQINYDKLLEWFISVQSIIISNVLNFVPPWSLSQLQNESHLLDGYLNRTNTLLLRIDAIISDTDIHMSKDLSNDQQDSNIGSSHNYFYENLVLTPTIKCPTKKDVRIAIWEAICMDSPTHKRQSNKIDDTSGFGDRFGLADVTKMRKMSTKLDPISMLSTAMNRNKGLTKTKTKASPRRNKYRSSPFRLNSMPAFNSTMFPIDDDQLIQSPKANSTINRINCSPLPKRLFS